MSFRFELKIPGPNAECLAFVNELKRQGALVLHPPRFICSEYFDTNELACVRESQEGMVPRKKIRIRSYPSSLDPTGFDTETDVFSLEKKVSSPEGRFKTSDKISREQYRELMRSGLVEKGYGVMKPSVCISYYREYFSLGGIRITYDTAIRARCRRSHYKYRYIGVNCVKSVIELKGQESEIDQINEITSGMRLERFSKYADCFARI